MKKFLAAIVYTHLWIALCAAAMVLQTAYLISGSWRLTPLVCVTFGGTLFIYAIHRVVGLAKLKDANATLNPRYLIIDRDQQIVTVIGIIGAGIAAYFYFHLQKATQLWFFIPAVISLAYVVPFLSGRRRLRDVGVIKIFLIAITYAILCVILVHVDSSKEMDSNSWLLFAEKSLFIFAITIPFDIRDLEVDKFSGVDTIPKIIGWERSLNLSVALIVGCILLTIVNGLYVQRSAWMAIIVSYLLTGILVKASRPSRPDLHYSFVLDGLMIAQTAHIFVASLIA